MRPGLSRRAIASIAAAAVLLLLWAFWPSPFSKVKNLDSRGTNVIAFGDSLTAGYGAGPGEDYPSRLSETIGVKIVNAGVNGDTTASALARVDDVLSDKPRIVLVGLGGNDFLQGLPIATTEENLRKIARRIQAAGAMVVLLGFHFPTLGANYGTMYEQLAKSEGCLLVPDLLAGILSDPNMKSDEVHPNARGYALMAERLAGPCRKLIAKADKKR